MTAGQPITGASDLESSKSPSGMRSPKPKVLSWCTANPCKTFALLFAFFAVFVLATAHWRIARESHLVTGDGFYYYCYARSLFFDHDVNFKNEYEDFGPICMGKTLFPMSSGGAAAPDRPSGLLPEPQPSRVPAPYGPWGGKFPEYPGNMWEIGSGILWLPFVALAHLATLAARAAGATSLTADGYSILYQCSIAVGSSFYALLGACLVYKTLRTRFDAAVAFFPVLFLITATALVCYLVYQVAYSHAQEFFAASLVFFLLFRPARFDDMSFGRAAALGLAIGLMALVRWQMVLWGTVPLGLWLWALVASKERGRVFFKGLILGAAACVAFLPQMLAWHSIYGQYITMPMDKDFGRHFLMLRFREMLLVLVSNNHGMFFWHPITAVGIIGVFVFLFSRMSAGLRGVVALSLVVFVAETFVNGMVPDWWGGSSFGMRRMIGTYPLIALGLASLLSVSGLAKGRGLVPLGAWAVASAWNAALLFIWTFHLGGRLLPH
jgi:hypothetical protein